MNPHMLIIGQNERGRYVAQVWVRVGEVELPPEATPQEAEEMAAWLRERTIEAEDAQDHQDTVQSVLAASYPI